MFYLYRIDNSRGEFVRQESLEGKLFGEGQAVSKAARPAEGSWGPWQVTDREILGQLNVPESDYVIIDDLNPNPKDRMAFMGRLIRVSGWLHQDGYNPIGFEIEKVIDIQGVGDPDQVKQRLPVLNPPGEKIRTIERLENGWQPMRFRGPFLGEKQWEFFRKTI